MLRGEQRLPPMPETLRHFIYDEDYSPSQSPHQQQKPHQQTKETHPDKRRDSTLKLRSRIRAKYFRLNSGTAAGKDNKEISPDAATGLDNGLDYEPMAFPTPTEMSSTRLTASVRGESPAMSAMGQLHDVMVSYRHQNLTVLCRLLTLNQNIQDYKRHLRSIERRSSSVSSDLRTKIFSPVYENVSVSGDAYVNEFFHRTSGDAHSAAAAHSSVTTSHSHSVAPPPPPPTYARGEGEGQSDPDVAGATNAAGKTDSDGEDDVVYEPVSYGVTQ